jgi:hypothetical protein
VLVPLAAPWSHCSPASTAPLPQTVPLLIVNVSSVEPSSAIDFTVSSESLVMRTSMCW